MTVLPPSRLPDDLSLGTVHLQVADLARSLTYYQRVIGLLQLSVSKSEAILGVGTEPLLALHERPGARPVGRHSRLGLYHFAILLADRPALGRVLAHLGGLGVPAASADHAVSEAVYLWDPDGLGIELYSDRPRGEWQRRGGEIYMTTEPLDVNAVVSSAAGKRWTGLPVDTRIGHMHLHVGAISQAENFYHRYLGLDKTVSSYPGALFMSAGGYHHHLGINTWAANAPPSTEGEARLLEWTIVLPTVDDVRNAVTRLEAGGCDVKPDGNDARVSDPWGTVLCLTSRVVAGRESVVASP